MRRYDSMRKGLPLLALATFLICFSALAGSKVQRRVVTFQSNFDCEKCQRKIEENIAFERGVKDLEVNLNLRTIRITFDAAKTDTARLAKAIRDLGYSAKVSEYDGKAEMPATGTADHSHHDHNHEHHHGH